jgi:hypothetical protein
VVAGTPCATEARLHTGQRLDLQRDVLDHVTHPSAALHAFPEAALMVLATAVADHGGQQGLDALVETGDLVRGLLLQVLDIEAHDDEVMTLDGPVVGATHGLELEDAHVVYGGKPWRKIADPSLFIKS